VLGIRIGFYVHTAAYYLNKLQIRQDKIRVRFWVRNVVSVRDKDRVLDRVVYGSAYDDVERAPDTMGSEQLCMQPLPLVLWKLSVTVGVPWLRSYF